MKKIYTTIAIVIASYCTMFAQNSNPWPTTGNVGIGTTTPGGLLTLAGDISKAAWGFDGINLQLRAATYTNTTSSGTVNALLPANTIGIPTFAATSATTFSNVATLYIDGAPAAGTNATITNANALYVNGGARVNGGFTMGLGRTAPAWGANGVNMKVFPSIYTDSSTPASTLVGINTVNSFAQPTLAATNTAVTYGDAATVYIDDAPIAGTNVTLTNRYALLINGGGAKIAGEIRLRGAISKTAWGVNGIAIGQDATFYTDLSTPASTTVTSNMVNAFGTPTLMASNTGVSYTNAATVYIAGAPTAGTNVTLTNRYALLVNSGGARVSGGLSLGGSVSRPAWGANGIAINQAAANYGDNSTAASTTVTNNMINAFAIPTLTASNTGVTYSNAATVYIAGPPTAGTNVTLTNKAALVVGSGNVGIGTAAPSTNLDVRGTVLSGGAEANLGISPGPGSIGFLQNSGRMIVGWNRSASEGETDFIGNQGVGTSGGFSFYNYNNSGVETRLLRIKGDGNVGIGTGFPDAKLTVNGNIHSKEVLVDLNITGPDYVFKPDYKLPALSEIKEYVTKHHHLPEIPSADEMAKNGIILGEMNIKLLKKVEELTLYMIEKERQVTDQQKQIEFLKKEQGERIAALEKALTKLSTTR